MGWSLRALPIAAIVGLGPLACDDPIGPPLEPYQLTTDGSPMDGGPGGTEAGTPGGTNAATAGTGPSSVDTGTGGASMGDDTEATFGGGGLLPEYCPPGIEPMLEMGHGDIDFRPFDTGVAQLVMGHQGGYHIVIGLRGQGFDLADWGAAHMRATIGGEVLADYDTIVVMQCDEGGEFSEALWLNLIFEAQPPMLLGQTTFVEVTFTDISEVAVAVSGEVEISDDIVHL